MELDNSELDLREDAKSCVSTLESEDMLAPLEASGQGQSEQSLVSHWISPTPGQRRMQFGQRCGQERMQFGQSTFTPSMGVSPSILVTHDCAGCGTRRQQCDGQYGYGLAEEDVAVDCAWERDGRRKKAIVNIKRKAIRDF